MGKVFDGGGVCTVGREKEREIDVLGMVYIAVGVNAHQFITVCGTVRSSS